MSDFGWFCVVLIFFFGLIAGACWLLHSALPLWALLLMPSYKSD